MWCIMFCDQCGEHMQWRPSAAPSVWHMQPCVEHGCPAARREPEVLYAPSGLPVVLVEEVPRSLEDSYMLQVHSTLPVRCTHMFSARTKPQSPFFKPRAPSNRLWQFVTPGRIQTSEECILSLRLFQYDLLRVSKKDFMNMHLTFPILLSVVSCLTSDFNV